MAVDLGTGNERAPDLDPGRQGAVNDAALVGLVGSELPIGRGFKLFDVSDLLDRYELASDSDDVLHGRLLGKVLRDGNSRTNVRRSGAVRRRERVAMLGKVLEAARRKRCGIAFRCG